MVAGVTKSSDNVVCDLCGKVLAAHAGPDFDHTSQIIAWHLRETHGVPIGDDGRPA